MKLMAVAALFGCLAAAGEDAPKSARPPIASSPVVTVEGRVEKVQISMGQGMPFLEVKSAERVSKVYLGPMRFLMEQNFNPKSGEQVKATGYQLGSDIVGISVTLPAQNKVVKLRDENGYPVWRGGMMGGMGIGRGGPNR